MASSKVGLDKVSNIYKYFLPTKREHIFYTNTSFSTSNMTTDHPKIYCALKEVYYKVSLDTKKLYQISNDTREKMNFIEFHIHGLMNENHRTFIKMCERIWNL